MGGGVTKEVMLHAQMSRRLKLGADREHVAGAGHNVAIETNAGAAIGGTDDNCRTALRTTVDFAGEVTRYLHRAR